MSTTPDLFTALVDDAAVFPPGNAPLDVAVRRHLAHRQAPYAGCVGPLLVPASAAAELLDLIRATPPGEPLRVGVIGRPGTDVELVVEAVERLRAAEGVEVVGAEVGWHRHWRSWGLDVPLSLEVPRGDDQAPALEDLSAARAMGTRVLGKFRTGPTPVWPWPDEEELAAVLTELTRRRLPFKLTGGLHHAVRGTYSVAGVPEENHGLLNVLLATAAALDGGSVTEVAGLLGVRDAQALADIVSAWTPDTAERVRDAFTAYGCCEVTDPITELTGLGLLSHLPGGRP